MTREEAQRRINPKYYNLPQGAKIGIEEFQQQDPLSGAGSSRQAFRPVITLADGTRVDSIDTYLSDFAKEQVDVQGQKFSRFEAEASGLFRATEGAKESFKSDVAGLSYDEDTKAFLSSMIGSTDPMKLAEELRKFKAGEGRFQGYKNTLNFMALSKDRPGTMQLFGTQAGRQEAKKGMLSGETDGLLTGG